MSDNLNLIEIFAEINKMLPGPTGGRYKVQGGGVYKVQGEGVYKVQGSEDFSEKGRL